MAAPQKQAKKRSLRVVNEHFELVFNAAMATQVVFNSLLARAWRGLGQRLAHSINIMAVINKLFFVRSLRYVL
jgi:hypothetical protein